MLQQECLLSVLGDPIPVTLWSLLFSVQVSLLTPTAASPTAVTVEGSGGGTVCVDDPHTVVFLPLDADVPKTAALPCACFLVSNVPAAR